MDTKFGKFATSMFATLYKQRIIGFPKRSILRCSAMDVLSPLKFPWEHQGMCICCETGNRHDSDTVFSFTEGMQKLLHWLSFATEPAVPVAGKSGGEGGAAPCLYDRWCAAPQSHASSSQRERLVLCGDQVGGPDYTEDNLDLCSDRHDQSGTSDASSDIPTDISSVPQPHTEHQQPNAILQALHQGMLKLCNSTFR